MSRGGESDSRDPAGRDGSDHQNPMCAAPMAEPITKPSKVPASRALPLPSTNRVPDAQPPPTCIPAPNRSAPTAKLTMQSTSEIKAMTISVGAELGSSWRKKFEALALMINRFRIIDCRAP